MKPCPRRSSRAFPGIARHLSRRTHHGRPEARSGHPRPRGADRRQAAAPGARAPGEPHRRDARDPGQDGRRRPGPGGGAGGAADARAEEGAGPADRGPGSADDDDPPPEGLRLPPGHGHAAVPRRDPAARPRAGDPARGLALPGALRVGRARAHRQGVRDQRRGDRAGRAGLGGTGLERPRPRDRPPPSRSCWATP